LQLPWLPQQAESANREATRAREAKYRGMAVSNRSHGDKGYIVSVQPAVVKLWSCVVRSVPDATPRNRHGRNPFLAGGVDLGLGRRRPAPAPLQNPPGFCTVPRP
jgi:Ni,Fe-hydrogenase I large subunit